MKKKKQEIKKQQDKERNDEIDVQMLHDEINSGEIPKETEFYFGCPNQNYFWCVQTWAWARKTEILLTFYPQTLIHKYFERI